MLQRFANTMYRTSLSCTMHLAKEFTVSFVLALTNYSITGPITYGLCQAGCSGVVMACYSAAGSTWRATLGATVPPTIIACNTAFGCFQAVFAAFLLAPTL